ITKKQHPTYQNIIKEINEKHYEKAESLCKEFLNFFPKSYSLRCILAYIYRCLNNYEQAHLYLEEAIDLNPKKPVAHFLHGEIYFRQNKYEKAIDNLKKSLEYKVKLNNLYIILGNSYLLRNYDDYDYTTAAEYYNISLKNDSNNYICLKSCAYSYEKQRFYLNALMILDKLLDINKKDSLVLCYYGEILYNMNQYNLDKIIQLDPSNSSAYYLKSLTYYTKNDIEYLLNKNSPKDLNNMLTKVNQISNIRKNKLLLMIRCNIHIELNKYDKAKVDLDMLFKFCDKYYEVFPYVYLLQKHSDFWSYLYKVCKIDKCDFTKLGITNEFSKYMYEEQEVYFISNLTNLNSELCQFQENDASR
ncbi:protein prenylyltransferase, partial [Rhizophagus irregularis]